jgi:YVTN family beta-propeller protein
LKKLFCISVVWLFASCIKDKPLEPEKTVVSIGSGHKTYVTCEGNFLSNNASVSLYDIESGTVADDIYKSQNNNAALGDVCQSMCKANNNYYLVINNSGKIVVVSSDNFKLKTTISGFTSPRYVLPVTYQKAYVSDLSSNSISVIDLTSNTKTGSIPCNGWTEQMALIYNKAFVTNMKKNYAYVINTINDQITDSVNVGINAGSIVTDKNSKIWILSSGNKTNNIAGKLSRIDPISLQVEMSLNFSTSDTPGNLCINAGRDTLYFLNTHVFRMPISSSSLPSGAFINNNSNVFYGLGINDKDHTIYISDAIDYVQKSSIMIYRPDGTFKTSFKAGINASGFYFE